MEPIVMDEETKYIRGVDLQKRLQYNDPKSKQTKKMQSKVQKYAKKYGIKLIQQMIRDPYIVRTYVAGPKSAMDFITASGHITIYSHPQNPSVQPKLEIHHPSYGFVAWWNRADFAELDVHNLWNVLCDIGKYNPDDATIVLKEQQRIDNLLRE